MNPRASRKPFQSKGRSSGGKRFGSGGKRFGSSERQGSGERSSSSERYGSTERTGGSGKRFGSGGGKSFGGGGKRFGSGGKRFGSSERGGTSEGYGSSERTGGGKRFGSSGGKRFGSSGGKRFGSSDQGGSSEGYGNRERTGGGKRFGSSGGKRFGGGERGGSSERYGNKERYGSKDRASSSERYGTSERSSSERYGNKDRYGSRDRGGSSERYGTSERGGGERYGNKERYGSKARGSNERYGTKERYGSRDGRGNNERYGNTDRNERTDRPASSPSSESSAVTEAGDGASRYVFGVNPALEAIRARPEEIERVYFSEGALSPSVAGELMSRAQKAELRVDRLPKEKLSFYAGGGVHQGVVLQMQTFRYAEFSELLQNPGIVVVLDSLQDPQNVGAIIRSANAFGANGVVIAKDRAASITGAVVKASAGATEKTRIAQVTNISRALEELKEVGYWIAAADPEGEPLHKRELKAPLAIVVGAEGPGVRPGVLSHCDYKLRIPISGDGVASLNASVAAGILLYEIARQQNA